MKVRRYAQSSTSEEEEEEEEEERVPMECGESERLPAEKEEEEEEEEEERVPMKCGESERLPPEDEGEGEGEEEDVLQGDPVPKGKRARVSGEGSEKRTHYKAFEFAGNRYTIEDPVLLAPESAEQKPGIAIIKDITQTIDGTVTVTGQLFYRPEEVKKKDGGSRKIGGNRELYYSTDRVEVPATSVMHKCVVRFVPINRKLPDYRKHPGFIVQQIYDSVEQIFWEITDKDRK